MKKPHEETWKYEPSEDGEGGSIFGPAGRMILDVFGTDAEGRLGAKAPEMARLLLEHQWGGVGGRGNGDECQSCLRRPKNGHAPDCAWASVLHDAGVLP